MRLTSLWAPLLCLALPLLGGEAQTFAKGSRPDLTQLGFHDGKRAWKVEDFKGKVVVVDFWAIWCPPCRQSLPELRFAQQQGDLKGDWAVVPVNLDEEGWPKLTQFLHRNQKALDGFRAYRAMTGRQGIATNLGADIQAFPTTLVIDREGRLAVRWSGYGEGLLAYHLNAVLREEAPGLSSR